METMLQKSGVFADKFRTMAFSEAALFPGKKQAIEAQRVVKQLQKRKYRVIIFGFSGREALEEKARRLGLDGYILLDSGDEKNDLVRSFKKAVKKNGAGMGETAVIAARTEEEGLMEAAGCGVYFGKNPVLEKKANRAIKSLAEALLLEEE
jgi:phosphoserine phosphatase